MLAFAAQHPDANPLAGRKQSPDNLFTLAEPVEIELEDDEEEAPSAFSAALARVRTLLSRQTRQTDAQLAEFVEVVAQFAEQAAGLEGNVATARAEFTSYRTQGQSELNELRQSLNGLREQFNAFEEPAPRRPLATGGDGRAATDC